MSLDFLQLVHKLQAEDSEEVTVDSAYVHFWFSSPHRSFMFSHLRFPLRSPAAKRWPSGLIPSTLIPDLPSWLAPSAFSASALRYCVSSSTYTILTMSWNTTINEYEKNVLARYSVIDYQPSNHSKPLDKQTQIMRFSMKPERCFPPLKVYCTKTDVSESS